MHPGQGEDPPSLAGVIKIRKGGSVFPDENQDAEEAFGEWLARYRDEELGGSIAAHGLASTHLRAAFMAGLLASTGEPAERS